MKVNYYSFELDQSGKLAILKYYYVQINLPAKWWTHLVILLGDILLCCAVKPHNSHWSSSCRRRADAFNRCCGSKADGTRSFSKAYFMAGVQKTENYFLKKKQNMFWPLPGSWLAIPTCIANRGHCWNWDLELHSEVHQAEVSALLIKKGQEPIFLVFSSVPRGGAKPCFAGAWAPV